MAQPVNASRISSWREVLRVFLKLGLTSFGGPVAHLGYFRTEFVKHRKWLDGKAYADLAAVCGRDLPTDIFTGDAAIATL